MTEDNRDVTFFDVDITLGNWDRGTGLFPVLLNFLDYKLKKGGFILPQIVMMVEMKE